MNTTDMILAAGQITGLLLKWTEAEWDELERQLRDDGTFYYAEQIALLAQMRKQLFKAGPAKGPETSPKAAAALPAPHRKAPNLSRSKKP